MSQLIWRPINGSICNVHKYRHLVSGTEIKNISIFINSFNEGEEIDVIFNAVTEFFMRKP